MKILAIIPARGGSKGIPRKNARPLAGKPLVAHTIEAARKSRLVDRVVVSTDDPEISEISKNHGAEVVLRPGEISTDTSSSESALLHVLDFLKETEGYKTIIWSGDDYSGCRVPSGLYFIQMVAGDYREIKKAILLK